MNSYPLIYFDWNVFKYLKKKYVEGNITNDPFFIKLAKLSLGFYIPYSNTHLFDLNKGFDGSKDIYEKIKDDLEFVKLITNNWCLAKYWGKASVILNQRDPLTFFDEVHTDSKKTFSITEFNNICKDLENYPEYADKMNELLNTEIVNIIPVSLRGKFPVFNKADQMKDSYTFKELLKMSADLFDNTNKGDFQYKQARGQLNLFTDFSKTINPQTATPEIIDDWLKKTYYKKTFRELVDEYSVMLRFKGETGDENYYKISAAYILLDMLGVGKDELKGKCNFENLKNDALHVYYGSLSTLFITEDKAMKLKSSIIYQYFNIKTPVLNIEDCINRLEIKIGAKNKINENRPGYKKTKAGWIPEEWEDCRIKDIAIVNPHKTKTIKNDNKVIFLGMADISESGKILQEHLKLYSAVKSGFTYFEKEDILIAKITPCFENYKGAFLNNISKEIGFGSTEFHVLRSTNKINNKLLFYFTRTYSFRKYGEANMTGTAGQKRVPVDFIKSYTIPIPLIFEQNKIVSILSTWDKAIEKMEALITAKEKRRKGLIQQLLTKRYEKWKHLKVIDIFQCISDKNNSNFGLLSVTQDRGVIPRTMLNGRVMSPQGSTSSYKLIKKGDFVISLRSFQGGIEYSTYKGIISPAYTVLRPKININKKFYKYFFKTYLFINKYLNIAVIGIRDGKQINIPDFFSIKIPCPTIKEQEKISIILNSADIEIDLCKKELEKLEDQKKGLMQVLLTGKIKVKV